MKLIMCLDDRNGLLFNNRRQSSDRAVVVSILQMCAGKRLWMNHYSAKLFKNAEGICVSEFFLNQAGTDDFVFVENEDALQALSNARMLIIYRWNRVYPSDVKFPGEVPPAGWKCLRKTDFAGHSHEKITLEVYSNEAE